MATKAYFSWIAAGRPWDPATPIAELEAWAQRNGIAVLGTIGNEEHLTADKPQDHTPFSVTAWPVGLPGYIVTAIDLANERGLGQKIEDQARAGELPWLKYMNHSGQHLDSRDLDGDGLTWEEYPSSDEHVHLSIRTDWISRSIGDFDPFGDNDMGLNFNERQVLNALANLADTMVLDTTTGNEDGTGDRKSFPVPFTTAVRRLEAAAAADATRDAAVLAAVTALANAGGVDAAPIVAAIKAEAEATRTLVTHQHQEEMAALKREWDAEVAGLTAELAKRPPSA